MSIKKIINHSKLYLFFITKIPLITLCFPQIKKLTTACCHLYIPLTFFTKNHVKSMYFGVLMVGVDLSAGLLAMDLIKKSKQNISIIFKDTAAQFLKRANHGVRFECNAGQTIQHMIDSALKTKERCNKTLNVTGYCQKTNDPVATFSITLSIKAK